MNNQSSADNSYQHRARKRFGQNFLVDEHIIEKIVQAIHPAIDDALVEIGPGQGALTRPLLERCPSLQVVELDRDLADRLRQWFGNHPEMAIHQADALTFDFASLTSADYSLRIVGNLPYNISTPLMFKLLSFNPLIKDMHFMLQKEVVDRLGAQPGSKSYGRLSVMMQYYCKVEPLFHVPPHAFKPMPKVDSAIVRLTPHRKLPSTARDTQMLQKVVKTCFQQRRKTLRNNLKQLATVEQLEQLPFDLAVRPERLSFADFVQLSNILGEVL